MVNDSNLPTNELSRPDRLEDLRFPHLFIAQKKAVMNGSNCVAIAVSHSLAKRIAKLLNQESRKP